MQVGHVATLTDVGLEVVQLETGPAVIVVLPRRPSLPGLPPQTLQLTEDAIYCARQGDAALPDSMVCRIDYATGDLTVRVFPSVTNSAYTPAAPDRLIPDNWSINPPVAEALFSHMAYTEMGVAVSGDDRFALLDPVTLEINGVFDLGEQTGICSTTGLDLDLVPQPGLPAPVAVTRQAIFNAAMACDYDGLQALADAGDEFFTASFGGSDISHYRSLESRGGAALAYMARLLNLAYAIETEDAVYYTWPSAFRLLESPYGDGLPDTDYQMLLELYTVEGLQEMFDGIGGYVGFRHGIIEDGEWWFFVAGD